MVRKLILNLALVICYMSIYSCDDDKAFPIGDNLVNINSSVVIVDTISLNTYTVKADSIRTSGYQKALVGRFTDGNFGTVTASSYFQLALPASLALDENAKFDSVCLILRPTGYSYGDSTKPYTINVHKLSDELIDDENPDKYNISKINYDQEILGSKTSIIKPALRKDLSVKLSEIFGRDIFNIILNEGEEVDNQSNFIKYLKGLALTTDESSSSSIMQFNASDSTSRMRLYYHVGKDDGYLDFNLANASYQYNRIESNYGDGPLSTLIKKEDEISSVLTGNESYCQAGTGVMTKIEIPYLKNLFETYSTYKILKAELIVKPVKKSYSMVPLPNSILLYSTNTLNDIEGAITDSKNNPVQPTLVKDNLYNETAYYFDVTYYVTYMMSNLKDDAPALLLSLPLDASGSSLERLILGNYNHPANAIRLKITYWKY